MNSTIASITARGLVGRRRFLLLLPLPLLLLALAVLMTALLGESRPAVGTVLIGFGLAIVVPLTALVIGTGVFGPEIDDGTILHILAKPLPRWEIVLTKLAVALAISVPVCAASMFVAGLIVADVRLGVGFAVGAAVAAAVYCAIFGALSLVSRRPVLFGLLYVLVWEGMLANLVAGTGNLSVQQYAVTLADKVSGSDLVSGNVSLAVSIVMASVLTVGATVLSVNRLRSFSVIGANT